MNQTKLFILTDEWDDIRGKNTLRFYGISEELGPVEVIIDNYKPVFFINRNAAPLTINVPHLRKQTKLKSFSGDELDALYFRTQRDLRKTAEILENENIVTYESDIDPARRYLMEHQINAQMHVSGEIIKKERLSTFVNPKVTPCEITPQFTCVSLDIETGIKNTILYSIAVHLSGKKGDDKKVFITGDKKKVAPEYIIYCESEYDLLNCFFKWFMEADPDIIIGWHVIGFDLMFLEEKCRQLNIPLALGRTNGRISLRTKKGRGNFASIPGRVVIDGPPALRAGFYSFEDYKLETVAQQMLQIGKTITPDQNKTEEIERFFAEDKIKLAEYNLNDAILVTEIFRKSGLIELSVTRAQLSGLLIDRLGMMTAAFDHFFLPKIHRVGYAAPNIKDMNTSEHAAGGYVIDPKPGIYDDVVVLDFKSLYPSIIQTFNIDPLSRLESFKEPVTTPAGYSFSSTSHFLPEFIAKLMQQRSEAKKKNDKYLSQAIKILMNSFYGVMGSYGCRFYHPALPSAITGTGQWLLLGSREFLEGMGYFVVYGDTDSLFVKLKEGEGINADFVGEKIAVMLNEYWKEKLLLKFKVKSYLEIEYEKYYKKFVITPARGSETGAKKRYAGLKINNNIEEIEFVGMEFVRSDWTRLAKEFQVELYKKVFAKEEVINWIRTVVQDVKNGKYDAKLIYRKRIRKDFDDYKNIPPQVRAAKMLNETSGSIQYVITKRGPIPVELEYSDIDYQHYIDKQLKPIADSVLALLGGSFDEIVQSGQLNFFD